MPNTTAGSILATAGGVGAGIGAGASWGLALGPVGAAVGAGVGALLGLIGDIGSGRRVANTMTQNGGPQDIINKQLAAIAASGASADDKAQATTVAWNQFIQATNQFASQGAEQAQVAKQAIYQTPALIQTVQSLMGGVDPLGSQFTSQMSPSIASATPQSGVTLGSVFAPAAAGAAAGFTAGSLNGPDPSGNVPASSVGNVDASGNPTVDSTGGVTGIDANGNPTYTPTNAPTFSNAVDANGNPIPTVGGPGSMPAGGYVDPTTGQVMNANGTVYTQGSSTAGAVDANGNPVSSTTTPGGNSNTPGATSTASSLMQRLFPSLVSAGTSLLAGGIGANAANNAAQIQANAANNAAALQAQTAANALAFQKQTLAQQQANIQPWITAGTGALNTIQQITSAPGYGWNQTFQNPTLEQALASPQLQFQMQQGEAALLANQRATGTSMSGAAAKEAETFGQGVASQNYNSVAANMLAAYNTNYNTFANERQAQLNPQEALAGLGQTSAGQLNTTLSNSANLNTNTQMTAASNVGNLQQQAAQATASGYIGSTNSWLNALKNIGNTTSGLFNPSPVAG